VQLSFYGFVHNLFQQYLYGGLDEIERTHLHRYMGEALEAFFGERTEEVAAQLARHFEEGGVPAKAAVYRLQAGIRAHRMSAHQEAVAHLTRGLELLDGLPRGAERMQLELRLQIALGVPLVLVRGHAALEVEKVYSRAKELCDQVCDEPQRFHVLMGLRRFYFFRGELGRAHDLGEQLLAQAERIGDPAYLSRAHAMHGETLYRMGMFSQSREHCAAGYELYDPVQHRSHVFLYGNDTRALCCIFGAVSLWPLGYPDQALAKAREAIALAEDLDHPFTRCIALFFNALLHRLRREAQAAQERAESALQIATDRGFALVRATGKGPRGWALAEQGHEREGIDQIQQGIAACRSNGAGLELITLFAHLSEAYGRAGETERALDRLDEAFSLVERTGERFWEAELYRLKGEMLLKQGEEREAEAAFRRAIDVARGQGARSWELRAAISLARLWREQGNRTEAGELLREIYSWFSEGFDTADLVEAQALLATLA
jgi:predicted ATPase